MVDLGIIVLVVLLSFKGYWNGFVRELAALVGLVGGIFIAARTAAGLGTLLHQTVQAGNPALWKLVAFLAVLGAIWGASTYAVRRMGDHAQPHMPRDRWLGVALAGVKYLAIVALISASVLRTDLVRDRMGERLQKSRLVPLLSRTGAYLLAVPTEGSTRSQEAKHG
jgi:membrane protein required for colicin V production